MSDYISRQTALDALPKPKICEYMDEFGAGHNSCAYDAEKAIEDVSSADVVPVVRCRDCIHHHYESTDIPYCDRIDYGYGWKDNDFCSRGERKEQKHVDADA